MYRKCTELKTDFLPTFQVWAMSGTLRFGLARRARSYRNVRIPSNFAVQNFGATSTNFSHFAE